MTICSRIGALQSWETRKGNFVSEGKGIRYPNKALKTFLFVTLLGPLPFAILALLLSFVSVSLNTGMLLLKGPSSLLKVLEILPFLVFFTYLFGGLSAILAGVISGLRIYYGGVLSILELLGIAAVSGFAGSLVLFEERNSPYAMGSPLMMTAISILCALVFIPLLRRMKILR